MRAVFRSLFLLSLLLIGIGVTGCKKPEYPACKKDKHCKVDLGEKCVDGTCQNCTTDVDCKAKGPNGEDWVCHELRCTDPSALPASGDVPGLGAPCTQTTDCASGLVCKAGKCSKCSDDVECAPGTCDLGTGLCGAKGGSQCQTDDDCSMDEICENGNCVFSGTPTGGNNPCGLQAVFFDFDSPKLRPEEATKLQQVAECVKQQNRLVYLEAHADPRGTEEYNIMLTDRRGQTVKGFLQDLGVTATNVQVIAKGDLEATGTDESSWAQDRRVEFVWP